MQENRSGCYSEHSVQYALYVVCPEWLRLIITDTPGHLTLIDPHGPPYNENQLARFLYWLSSDHIIRGPLCLLASRDHTHTK